MADYTVSAGHKGVGPWPLVASQVDSVTFADNVGKVIVINTGTVDVWVTTDGSTPSVPGPHVSTPSRRVPANFKRDVNMWRNSDTVKLISAGTPEVSVEVEDNN